MKFDVLALSSFTGLNNQQAGIWLPCLQETFEKFDINTPARVAAFIAQADAESSFRTLEENLNYKSAERILAIFPSHIDASEAESFVGQPMKLANRVYGGRMGNQTENTGDGWRFRGRGIFQLTGRSNYDACGKVLGINLLIDPDKLKEPKWAALSAGWFWNGRNLNVWADQDNIDKISKIINGGSNGLEERHERFEKIKSLIG